MVAIFVAFIFVALILTDLGVQKFKAWQAARATLVPAGLAALKGEALWELPDGIHLSDAHTWFRPDPAGGLEIGADRFITHAVGAVRRIILPERGEHVTAGQPLFRIEHDSRSVTIPSTLTGKVVAVNGLLHEKPELLTFDPYGRGWVCQLAPTSVGAAPAMRFGEKAIQWLESEFSRLREFLFAQASQEFALGATSQDGGYPASGCLGELDERAWSAFQTEFLKSK
jgi:glycine cleavage system H protein